MIGARQKGLIKVDDASCAGEATKTCHVLLSLYFHDNGTAFRISFQPFLSEAAKDVALQSIHSFTVIR